MARVRINSLVLILLALVLCAFFQEVLLGGVYYPGDTARIYLPQRSVLAEALREGRLPWWSSAFGAGYPLLAEGEVGALYPLNWLLYGLLPTTTALTLSIVLHYVIAGTGLFLLARVLRLSRSAALIGALSWALGGFCIAHLSHVSILTTVAWLPWMLWLTRMLFERPDAAVRASLGLALVVGLQFLAGHPQMALLNLIALALFALAQACASAPPRLGRRVWLWLAALAGGALLGAAQLLPSMQLGALSQRGGGLAGEFFISYSFHPLLLSTYLSPFALGNPYPEGSIELMGYIGLLPLFLASVALWRSRRRMRWFFVALGALGVTMAFGRWNPLYAYLERVPVLNLFRVPARYLCWTSLSLALLAAFGWDALASSTPVPWIRRSLRWLIPLAATLFALLVCVASAGADTEMLIACWRWFPLVLTACAVALLATAQRTHRTARACAAIALLLVDLYAYGAVLDQTYSSTLPRTEVEPAPLSAAVLTSEEGPFRLYTKEEILPALAPLREALYPNIAASYQLSSANLYMPLIPTNYADLLNDLDAQDLNTLNVRYYLIPQLLPVDEASELYDVANPFADLPYGRWLSIPEQQIYAVAVESYLSHAADLPDGALAAEIVLRDASGYETRLPVRAGLESAEWAYERSDVLKVVAHSRAPLASTWPARSGYPPEDHEGHTYLATYAFARPLSVAEISIQPVLPEAFVRLVRVQLETVGGHTRLLSHLLGLGDHQVVYRSEDVLIYRNEDALPRAFVISVASVQSADGGIALPAALRPADVTAVDIVEYGQTEVRLHTTADGPAYLVLLDLDYPGWRATVNDRTAAIVAVDGLYRAVRLAPGDHTVRFTFHPLAGVLGSQRR